VVEKTARGWRMLRLGALRCKKTLSGSPASHLREIHSMVCDLIAEFQPHGVAVESVFTSLNVKTALKLAEVRGVILLAAAQARIPSYSYTPREIKMMVAGYGNADKQQVQQMVRSMLGLGETPEPADAADALAVALCHMQMAEANARLNAGLARGHKAKAAVTVTR
jgi:crossover junction endodeoxyribonuclease RuvC